MNSSITLTCLHQLQQFNKIAIQAKAQMAADKEAIGLSRVHVYKSMCILRDNCQFCS